MPQQPAKNERTIYNLSDALTIAQKQFSTVDISAQCKNSGALCSPKIVTLTYLNEIYCINIDSGEVAFVDSKQPVPLRDKILILHYFIQAKGTALTGKHLPYRDMPGGLVYLPTFIKRSVEPLIEIFGKEPAKLVGVGKILGARPGTMGDASLIIDVFTRIPINIILWAGDEELKAEVNLLFDANILDYLTSEDITIVCETLTWQLVNYAKKV